MPEDSQFFEPARKRNFLPFPAVSVSVGGSVNSSGNSAISSDDSIFSSGGSAISSGDPAPEAAPASMPSGDGASLAADPAFWQNWNPAMNPGLNPADEAVWGSPENGFSFRPTHSFSQEPLPPELKAGSVLLHRYELEERLGQGGMGEVWKTYDRISGVEVALKFVPRELLHFEAEWTRVRETFVLVHDLAYPGICPLYQLEKEPVHGYFLVMKWLEGESLGAFFRRKLRESGVFPSKLVPQILLPVARALDYAHSRRIIHRDVKPNNIFVKMAGSKAGSVPDSEEDSEPENVWLIDFGIASEIRQSMGRVSRFRVHSGGTRPYMPPEQWLNHRQDGRTDQYSLAVVAYELLAGHLPFRGKDPTQLRQAILHQAPEPLPNVPSSVNTALQKALSKEREDRFDSCGEFVCALLDV